MIRWREKKGAIGSFGFLLLSTLLDAGTGRLPSVDAGIADCRKSPDCV